MKKIYNAPELRVSIFEGENVVTVSGDPDAYNILTDSNGTYKIKSGNVTLWNAVIAF